MNGANPGIGPRFPIRQIAGATADQAIEGLGGRLRKDLAEDFRPILRAVAEAAIEAH